MQNNQLVDRQLKRGGTTRAQFKNRRWYFFCILLKPLCSFLLLLPAIGSYAANAPVLYEWFHLTCAAGPGVTGRQFLTCEAALDAGIADTLADATCKNSLGITVVNACTANGMGSAGCAFCGDVHVSPYCEDAFSGIDVVKKVCVPQSTLREDLKTPNLPCRQADGSPCRRTVGNPIDPATGTKSQDETDYQGSGPFPLSLRRYFASLRYPNRVPPANFGSGWRHSYDARILARESGGTGLASAYRPEGRVINFQKTNNGPWLPDADITDKLVAFYDGNGNVTGWTYTVAQGDLTENYDASGRLISIVNRAGLVQTLTYNAPGLLTQVSDPFGRTLSFTYDSNKRVATITNPNAETYTYAYESGGHLSSVMFPDKKIRSYQYAPDLGVDQLLTLTDENSQLFTSWTYEETRRAASSTYPNGVDRVSLVYGGNFVTVTDAFGVARTYNTTVILGISYITTIVGPPCPSCGPASVAYNSSNGFPTSTTDWNGNRTNYVYDSRGLQTSRTEGLTSAGAVIAGVTRTITTAWHGTFRLPTLVTEKNDTGATLRTAAMSYDTAGNMLTRTITDTVSGAVRTWTYTYNANGQPLTVDGPRTDVNDVTTYTYYPNIDSDKGKAGNIASITNALGQTTQITAYNAHGQPLTIVDPNGLTTTLTYDARMRLTSRSVGGELTTYTYDGVGQLTKVTLPDSSFLSYTYDAAHRLTQITDSLGNKIVYTLDAMGNRTKEEVFDPSNALAQTRSRVYSSLNRLTQEIGAQGQTTTYAYDNQGNVTSIDGPLAGTGDTTLNTYDALNRLTRMTDPNSGQVNYGYNALDQMTSVKDPRNLTTSYAYDALNNMKQLSSPDTGTTQNTYDAAGNLLTQLDAKGQTTTYTYDALNRVTSISYATDASLNVTFTYDQGVNGLGRLTGVTDSTGTMSYAYEIHGRLISESRTIGGVTYTTGYSYDSAGRLASMAYPGGRQITYARDALGRINGISTTKNSITQNLLTTVSYRPFGPEQAYTFGNNQTYTRGYDQDGRIASYTLPNQSMAVLYDNASRITSLADTTTPANSLNYGYDLLDRLTSMSNASLNQGFTYDAVGNRTTQTIGANTYTNTYAATSNRIATSSSPVAKTFTFDANGSTTNDTVNQYTFDARGRLKQATTAAGVSQYLVNTMGQRVKKSVAGIDTVFHYDSGGQLISETDGAGNVKQEYVYLNDLLVAVLR